MILHLRSILKRSILSPYYLELVFGNINRTVSFQHSVIIPKSMDLGCITVKSFSLILHLISCDSSIGRSTHLRSQRNSYSLKIYCINFEIHEFKCPRPCQMSSEYEISCPRSYKISQYYYIKDVNSLL